MKFTKLVLLLILGSALIGCSNETETTYNPPKQAYSYNTNTTTKHNHTIKKETPTKVGKYDYIKNPQQAISIFGENYSYYENIGGSYSYTWWDKGIQASYNHKTGEFKVYEF